MKVKDLITKLSEYDPEMLVLIQGYEGGYDRFALKKKKVKVNGRKSHVLGQFEEYEGGLESLILMRGIDGDKR